MKAVERHMKKEGLKFVAKKRIFIHPEGNYKKIFISEDPKNIILLSYKVDTLNEMNAYNSRNLIKEKFNVKFNKNEVITENKYAVKEPPPFEFVQDYDKKKSLQNAFVAKKYLKQLEIKNTYLNGRLDKLLQK
jgi:hypothetical protein